MFAAGITLDRLAVTSGHVNMRTGVWQDGSVRAEQRFANKKIELGKQLHVLADGSPQRSGFAVYCNVEAPYESPGSREWRKTMLGAIAPAAPASPQMAAMRYLLGPQRLVARLSLDTDPTAERMNENTMSRLSFSADETGSLGDGAERKKERKEGADLEASLDIPSIDVSVPHEALKHFYNLALWAHLVRAEHLEHPGVEAPRMRPACAPDSAENRRVWWQFAIASSLQKHRVRMAQLQLPHIRRSLRTAQQYTQLYARKWGTDHRHHKKLREPELKELADLESRLDYLTLVHLRTIAWTRLYDREKANGQVSMTDAQLTMIGLGPLVPKSTYTAVSAHRSDTFRLRADLNIGQMNVALTMRDRALVDLRLEQIGVSFSKQASGSANANATLRRISVADCHTPHPLFEKLLSSQVADAGSGHQQFVVCFNFSKLCGADVDTIEIEINTMPVHIVLNHRLIDPMTDFVTMADHSVGIDENVKLKAKSKLEDNKAGVMQLLRRRKQLARAFKKQAVTLDCKICGPVVMLPERCSVVAGPPSKILVVDFGCLTIHEGNSLHSDYNHFSFALDDFDVRLDTVSSGDAAANPSPTTLVDLVGLEGALAIHKESFDPSAVKVKAELILPSVSLKVSTEDVARLSAIGASVLESASSVTVAKQAKQSAVPSDTSTKTAKRSKLRSAAQSQASKVSNALRQAFQEFDTGKDGMLDRSEMRGVLLLLGKPEAEVDPLLDLVWSGIDLNHDGTVDFEEFQSWWDGYIFDLLKEWRLLDLRMTVQKLAFGLRGDLDDFHPAELQDIISMELQDLELTVEERCLDQSVDLQIRALDIVDCEQALSRRPSELLQVQDVRVKVLTVQEGSPRAVDGQPGVSKDVTVDSISVAIRPELVPNLSKMATRAATTASESLVCSPQARLVRRKEKDLQVAQLAMDAIVRQSASPQDPIEDPQHVARLQEAADLCEHAQTQLALANRLLRERESRPALPAPAPVQSTDVGTPEKLHVHLRSFQAALLPSLYNHLPDPLVKLSTSGVDLYVVQADLPTTDVTIADICVIVPVLDIGGGVCMAIGQVQLSAAPKASQAAQTSIQLTGLALHHFTGGHDYLQSGAPTVEHPLLLSTPFDVPPPRNMHVNRQSENQSDWSSHPF